MPDDKKGITADSTDTDKASQQDDAALKDKDKKPDKIPEVPKGFEGKTQDDLIKMVQDAQGQVNQQAKEVGDLRNDLAYTRQMHEISEQKAKEATATKEQEPKYPEFDYQKPIESMIPIIEAVVNKRDKGKEKKEMGQVQAQAEANYREGKSLSTRRTPKLFDGIERDTENAMYNAYMSGTIGIHDLRNPDAWEMAANLLHLKAGKLDRLQVAGKSHSDIEPVSDTDSDLPNSAKRLEAEKSFTGLDYDDKEVQKMIDQYGLTKEKAEEIVREQQERVLRGEK